MNKVLKDGLKESVKYLGREYYSIGEALKAYYLATYDDGAIATYRDKFVILEIENNHDNVSLWSNLEKQINQINEELDGE
jgi:hypothetical protein